MSIAPDSSTTYQCQCIDPRTLNIANTTVDGTTATLTIPWNNHGLVFDVNVPDASSNPAMRKQVNMFFYQNPDVGNDPFPVQFITDGSGSCVITIVWDEKHNFHFMRALGQAHRQKTDLVLFNLDKPQYPTVSFFFKNWPMGWTVTNISSFIHVNTPLPTENALIPCTSQDGSAAAKGLNTGSAYSLCSLCTNSDPSPTCSSGGGSSSYIIYIVIAIAVFVGSALLIRKL